jgi:Myb-like DNA-binding domain
MLAIHFCREESRDSDNGFVKDAIYNLFVPRADAGGDDTTIEDSKDPLRRASVAFPSYNLKNLEDLSTLLADKPFNLDWLERKLVGLVEKWDNICFGSYQPLLVRLKYKSRAKSLFHGKQRQKTTNRMKLQTTPESGRRRAGIKPPRSREGVRRFAEELENLKRNRQALRNDHGEDPLETSRELAEKATGVARAGRVSKKPRVNETPDKGGDDDFTNENEPASEDTAKTKARALYEKKKSRAKLTFDDSDEEFIDEEDAIRRGRVQLGEVPLRSGVADASSTATPAKVYGGPPPDEGIFDECGNVLKRHPWEAEEIDALVAGVEKHGPGKWVQIKNEYGYILRNRNSVQLKDKFRNMKKKGELPDRFL